MGKKRNTKKDNKKEKNRRVLSGVNDKDIKKTIKKEIYSLPIIESVDKKNSLSFYNTIEEKNKNYFCKYSNYMIEEFNTKIVYMIILYVIRNKNIPLVLKNEPNFINKIISLIKHLLMNEFEVAAFTLVIDYMGWSYQTLDHWLYLCFLGIFTKQLAKSDDESSFLLEKISDSNPYFFDLYSDWRNEDNINSKAGDLKITLKQINERFVQLAKPVNSYCRKNFVDYNGIVDKIIKLSQPYGEESNGNRLKKNELWEMNDENKKSQEKKEKMPIENIKENKNTEQNLNDNLPIRMVNSRIFHSLIPDNTNDPFGIVFFPSQSQRSFFENPMHNYPLGYQSRLNSQLSMKLSDSLLKPPEFPSNPYQGLI